MGNVISLSQGGLSPALVAASEALHEELWRAIDAAVLKGIPLGLIVGHLEFSKAALIADNFSKVGKDG